MRLASIGLSVFGVFGAIAATLAVATIWLLLTDPVRGADTVSAAVTTGDLGPFMRAIGAVVYEALRGLFRFL